MLTLTSQDCLLYRRAVAAVKPTGRPLDMSAHDYAEAVKLLGPDSLVEAVKFYVANRTQKLLSRTVEEVVTELLEIKRANGRSRLYLIDLRLRLTRFSEAQQGEVENALSRLAEEDAEFSARLENEYVREENDVFCGLFVKNLGNVQGDERDIIIMSVCYGHDASGCMLMNFGPINQRGGEKRLNVIFSRAKHHMAIVSSIRHHDITNDCNDGASSLKNFLHYAEAVSKGDQGTARRVLENLNPLSRKALAPLNKGDAVVEQL